MYKNWIKGAKLPLLMAAAAAFLASGPSAAAQAVYGQILGSVTDSTGAAVPGATITVTDVTKNTAVTLTSNGAGEFTAQHLIPDTYDVKVTAAGFKGYEAKGLQVFADDSATVKAVLPVGAANGETVEVDADAVPQLKTDHADVAVTYTAQELTELPIPDHNFANLQLLLPGAVQLGWSHAADENPQGSKQIEIDGQAFAGVNYTLDGTDNQDAVLGIIVINPNSESMSEAKIATQNFDAEFGKAVASVDTIQTKSGTNQFHGTVFDNRESNANLARDPFQQGPTQLASSGGFPGGIKSQFGGSIGGPIIKDKVFFFGDYQGVRQKVGIASTATVPTSHLITTCLSGNGCDFSEYVNYGAANPATTSTGVSYNPYQIYEPNSTTPYPNAIIPNSALSPAALQLLKLLQPYAPNTAGTDGGFSQNYAGSGSGLFNSDQWDVRGDAVLNEKIHIFGRFSRFTDTLTGKTMFGNAGGPGFGLGGYGGTSKGANDSVALGTDIAINSKLVTDVRLGYFRYGITTAKYDTGNTNLPIQGENVSGTGANASLTVAQDFGAPGFNISDLNVTNPTASPNNPTGGGAQYGAGLNINRCNCPLTEREDQFQLVNNWTRTIGNHSVKVGIDLRYARNLRVPSDSDRTGLNNFGTGPTSNGSTGGLGFASLVLGDVTSFNRYAGTPSELNAKEFQPRDFFYGQDTWRATPKLTVNVGARYEYYAPERVNGKGNGALLNLATGYLNVAGEGGIPLNMGVAAAKNTWNPRLGVAYQIDQKTVIRAGYGRSFDLGVFGSEFGHVVTQNIPVLANQSISSLNGAQSYAFQLDNPAVSGTNSAGLVNYTPVAANAQGQIPVTAPIPGTSALGADVPCSQAGANCATAGGSVNMKARPFTERLPTLDAWNFSVQRSITPTTTVTVAYVANKGTHTLSDLSGNTTNPNEAAISLPASFNVTTNQALHFDPAGGTCLAGTAGCTNPVSTTTGATSNQTLLQRYTNGTLPACGGAACNWTQAISYYGDDQDTHYNSLQVSLAKTYAHGLSVNANYAYQRGRDANSSFATWNKQAVIGNDSSIRRNAFTAYGLYKLPFGKDQKFLNSNRALNYIVGGWEYSPTFVWQSGLPFTLSFSGCGNDLPGDAPCQVNGNPSSLHTGVKGFPGGPTGVTFFQQQTLGTTFTDPGLDTIGNAGRNTAWGPGLFNSDMSIMKNVTFHERYTVQFRMDAFNAFNHINFENPGGNIQNGNSIGGGPGPNGTTNPRQLQFTLHLAF
ncbi:hypothetical protein GOB94_07940 [Granulicella sp. 5B5]|uniref:TonB-dependent receptor domain-containing protein n=1 Tax=Granulicella sp. 5B5 TaxID=1617967 RepID=UPI0015F59918|nr:TonB-dependent receptor [Granulicella sp. 5B5]QMV18623.1 hypothetical protein GOB94_07940 [Granulicella sp. 5B5]